MGLLFPECFKATPVVKYPQAKFKDSRTSSTSSSRTLVEGDPTLDPMCVRSYQKQHKNHSVTVFYHPSLGLPLPEDLSHELESPDTDTEEDDSQLQQPLLSVADIDSSRSTIARSQVYLNRLSTLFCCRNCYNHICISNLIISDNFTGKSGELFLVSGVINTKLGQSEKKNMITGCYEVCDVNCKQCGEYLGWKYLKADSRREKYKVGKYVIEKLLFEEISVLGA